MISFFVGVIYIYLTFKAKMFAVALFVLCVFGCLLMSVITHIIADEYNVKEGHVCRLHKDASDTGDFFGAYRTFLLPLLAPRLHTVFTKT